MVSNPQVIAIGGGAETRMFEVRCSITGAILAELTIFDTPWWAMFYSMPNTSTATSPFRRKTIIRSPPSSELYPSRVVLGFDCTVSCVARSCVAGTRRHSVRTLRSTSCCSFSSKPLVEGNLRQPQLRQHGRCTNSLPFGSF